MFEQELVCAVALNKILPFQPGICFALYKYCGSYTNLFSLPFRELYLLTGKRRELAGRICDDKEITAAEKDLEKLTSLGVKAIHPGTGEYPELLRECADPPAVLFIKGDVNLNDKYFVSVVGTRRSTPYGEISCRKIISELASSGINPVIVSGLAYGIDICAHKAALDNGLKTVAVMPCGAESIYPSAHNSVAEKISCNGAILTEFPFGTPPFKMNFIQRNRIIAGLSAVTTVIESDVKGGALSTAELSQIYSREVFALPGKIGERASAGCNMLISRNIANIFISTSHFLAYLGWGSGQIRTYSEPDLFGTYKAEKEKIFVALKNNPTLDRDDLHRVTGLNIKVLSAALLEMELDGIINPLPAGRYVVVRKSL